MHDTETIQIIAFFLYKLHIKRFKLTVLFMTYDSTVIHLDLGNMNTNLHSLKHKMFCNMLLWVMQNIILWQAGGCSSFLRFKF